MFTLLLLYSIIAFVLLVGAFFIVYHILRYSLTPSLGYFGAVLFGVVFFFLLSVNFLSFQSLETESILPAFEITPLLETSSPLTPSSPRNPW